jgi:hypothetical protein
MSLRTHLSLSFCAFLLTACGTSQRSLPVPEPGAPIGLAAMPDISQLDVLWQEQNGMQSGHTSHRHASDHWWGHNIAQFFGFNWGSEPVAASPNTTVVEDTLEINTTPAEPFGYAIYDVPAAENPRIINVAQLSNSAGVVGQNGASLLSERGTGVVGQNGASVVGQNGASLTRGYALANYEQGKWKFTDSLDNGLVDLEDMPGDPSDYHSPAGNIYIAPIVYNRTDPTKLVISSVTGLPCDVTDTTPAPDVPGCTAAPVDSGVLLSWGDVGAEAGNVMIKVYISTHSFASPDEEAVLPLLFAATDREVTIPWNATAYVRAQAHHVKSCKDGTLTGEVSSAPTAGGDMPLLTVAVNRAEIEKGTNAIVTANGCDSYDWDLDGDGTYEFTGETTGQRLIFGDGEPGVVIGRVKGYAPNGTGIVIRNFSVIRHQWVRIEADPVTGGGRFLQLELLPDGRPVIAHTVDGVNDLQYCVANDPFGETWTVVSVDTNIPDLRDMQLAIANGKPVIVTAHGAPMVYDCYSPTTDDGASGWQKDADFVGGNGTDAISSTPFALLGNGAALGDNGAILVAYESGTGLPNVTHSIHSVWGTPDGAGGFNWSGWEIAIADADGTGGLGEWGPKLAYVDGAPVVYANDCFSGDPGLGSNGVYAYYDGSNWVGGEIPELFNISFRQLFDSNGRIAILYQIGFTVHYVVATQPGVAGGLDFTDTIVGDTDWFLPVLTRNGNPEFLGQEVGVNEQNYTITRANNPLPTGPADWTTFVQTMAPSNPWENGDWLYLPTGNPAIAHIVNGKVNLGVYY